MIEERDEWLHEVGSDLAWQESFYFNWADPEHRAFTLARTGDRFHPRKTDGLVISLRDGELEHVWRATPEQIGARAPRLAAIAKALRR